MVMFNSFKDKLKNWLKKAENESEDISSGIIEKEVKIKKKEKKAKEKKKQ